MITYLQFQIHERMQKLSPKEQINEPFELENGSLLNVVGEKELPNDSGFTKVSNFAVAVAESPLM